MASTIKVRRKDFIDQLSSIKHDNIGIADVVINRQKLLQALKLQTQPQAEVLTIAYGMLAWQHDGSKSSNDLEPEPCISFSCDHTVMRFLNRPKQVRYGQEPKIKYLNFIDNETYTKPELAGIPLDTQELLKALSFVLPCVATEQLRPVLNCVLLDCGEDVIKLVAADGFRLGIATIPADGIPQVKILIHPADLLTFLKSIKPIGKGKSKRYPEVYMTPDYGKVEFAYIGGSIEIDKQVFEFPDYTQLIPKNGTKVEFIASQLLDATKSLNAIAKNGSDIIRLQFQTSDPIGKVRLSASGSTHDGDNDSAIECDAKVDADCKIAVNTKYLIDLLRLCGDNIVDMRLTVPSAPMTFNMGGDKQQVIMPMFVQWGDKPINNKEPEVLDEETEEPTPEEIDEIISEPDEIMAGV